ncbi:MAG: hypothetical protein P0Y56_14360 [Candidatus Andeanibacterium colombiense]|uniref:Uncharacterized protein n=1 Tax=Candidatus Andeanibacterium colombiense TaxID=3121345 RepID=A0AAJ5X4B7_9SPHN|nr:MAG: hypothetical protein P0Y56_14360 [Sphingomonadaceae bacterium]
MESTIARGALAGWKRTTSGHGILLTLQVAKSVAAFNAKEFDSVELALNDRQLRSLARDLERAARSRGLDLRPNRTKSLLSWLMPTRFTSRARDERT